jgi:hypothetical protein
MTAVKGAGRPPDSGAQTSLKQDRPGKAIGTRGLDLRGDRRLALVVASGFAGVVAFQLSRIAGAPWGAAAYGGANHGRLPSELRVASVVLGSFWLLAGLTALSRGGLASPIPYGLSRRAMWALTALLAVGSVMNAASSSPWERYGWAPITLGLAVLSLQLARSGRHPH